MCTRGDECAGADTHNITGSTSRYSHANGADGGSVGVNDEKRHLQPSNLSTHTMGRLQGALAECVCVYAV